MSDQRPVRNDFEATLRFLRRRGIWIVLCAVIAGGAAVAWSQSRPKEYTATSVLLFQASQIPNELFGSAIVAPNVDPNRQAATNIQLVGLNIVSSLTARALGSRLTAAEVASKVQVQGGGQADLVTVAATDRNPAFAVKLANTFANQFVSFRRAADTASVHNAIGVVESQLAAAGLTPAQKTDLQNRAEQLRMLAALQTGGVERVQPAVRPQSPSSPRVARDGALGVGLGILLGIFVALILHRLDRRIRDLDDLKDAYSGLPLLGVIPRSRALRSTRDVAKLPRVEVEAFRMLHTTVRYARVAGDIRSVLVASASPSEGKSTIAWNLAVAAASAGVRGAGTDTSARVLLIEADFHRPSLAAQHDLRPTPGLGDLIVDELPLAKVVQSVKLDPDADDGPTLDVIPAGDASYSPAGLLQSRAATETLLMVTRLYGLVVIDTPPSAVVADALPLTQRVGGVLLVGRVGVTRRDAVRRMMEQLKQVDARIIGVVANDVAASAQGGAYYTYYGDYHSQRNGKKAQATPSAVGSE